MSKFVAPGGGVTFGPADFFGTWRVYVQRVDAKLAGSTTEIGQTRFGATGGFVAGTLTTAGPPQTTTVFTSGSATVDATGQVKATFLGAGASYAITGSMRPAKDLITGVLTAVRGGTTTHYGLVTLVRDLTVLAVAQDAYTVSEGGSLTVTVNRTGNMAGTITATYGATGDTDALAPPFTGLLTFGPNVASRTVTLTTAQNGTVDGARSVTLALGNVSGNGVLGAIPSATVQIADDDRPGTFRLKAGSVAVAETGKNALMTILRANGNMNGIVVDFATADGTALAGRDYTATSGSVTFAATETSRVVAVPILDNHAADGARTFTFSITPQAPGVAGTPTSAAVTIGDDDVAGTIQFKTATFSLNEPASGDATATITVTRTGTNLAEGVTVDFAATSGTATAGGDFTETSGTLTFPAGSASQTFPVTIHSDGDVEGDETVLLTLSNPGGGHGATLGALSTAVLTIKDAQKGVQFGAADYRVKEGATTAMISVVRTGPLVDRAAVRYSTSDGSAQANVNYVPAAGMLTFTPGVASQSFPVKILPDKLATSDPRTVLLLLSGANSSAAPPVALGPRSSAVLTIANLETGGIIRLSSAAYTAGEAGGVATITVTRSGGTAGSVTVDYATADQPCASPPCPGLAQASQDYVATSGTLTFGPTDTSKVIKVPIENDPTVEGPETFTIALANVQGGATLGAPSQAVVTITDNDQGGVVQLAAGGLSATQPQSGNASVDVVVTRTGTSLADGASVLLLTGAGTAVSSVDYVPVATTLVFTADEKSKTVPITVLANPDVTGNRTVPILLSSPAGGATLGTLTSALLTLVDANRSVAFSAPAYTVTEGSTAAIKVVRGGPSGGTIEVPYTVSPGAPADAALARQRKVSFAAGVMSQTIPVMPARQDGDTGNRSVTLTLGPAPAGVALGQDTATLTVMDKDGPGSFQFSAPGSAVTEGGTVTLTVTRTGGVGGQVTVPWTSNASATTDFTPTSGLLTFAPGAASKSLTLTAVNNTVVDANRSFTLTLDTPSAGVLGAPATASLAVLDNDQGGVIRFGAAAQTVAENLPGGVVTVGVKRTGANLAGGILADYAIAGDTGAVSSPLAGTLTFNPGVASLGLPVAIVGDPAPQLDRSLTITLSNPRSANGAGGPRAPALGTPAATALKITDTRPRVQFSAATFDVVEGQPAAITVTRTGTSTGAASVDFATADGTGQAGTDYTPASGTLAMSSAARTFLVPTTDDGVLAGSRTVLLSLGNAVGASIGEPSAATLTIHDRQTAGTVQFATATASVQEGGVVHVTVTRTGANLVGNVSVEWSATGVAATAADVAGALSGTLTFAGGEASRTFDIVTKDDGEPEGTEALILSLAPPTGGAALGTPSAMTIYLIDQQQTVGFLAPETRVGETTASARVQVVRSGVPNGTVSVEVSTVDDTAVAGLDYTALSSVPVVFGPGEIVKAVSVPILTQNAAARAGNRALSLVLGNPDNAALTAANASTLTILDFRADLVIASVTTPAAALTGKAAATPSTVRNLGPVAAGAFQIGIFMVRADADDALLPGAGSLVATQEVAGLAPGASATFPTQVNIDDGFPAGDYYISAVANFASAVAESDAGNNGLSSAPSAITISKNLTKFTSASGAFSQTSPSAPAGPAFVPLAATCDATGSVALTGTFQINSQQGNTAVGQASLTGSLNDAPVQYLMSFTGTGDDNGNVTAVLDSVVFRSLTTALTGSGDGSLTGTLDGRTLRATVSGQFTTSTGGACVFTGTLDAEAQTSFRFGFGTTVSPATFGFDPTPSQPVFPVKALGHGFGMRVFFDDDFPDPATVLFTGPSGSGVLNVPAEPEQSEIEGHEAVYRRTHRPGNGVGGRWTVLYKGKPRSFVVPPFNANASLVVVFPTVTVDVDGNLTRIDWVYRDRENGTVLSSPPSFVSTLSVSVDLDSGGDDRPQSGILAPSTTSFDIAAAGYTPPPWASVRRVEFEYRDLAGNRYVLDYGKQFSIQVEPRLENTYGGSQSDGTPAYPAGGSRTRALSVFVDVPAGSVDTQPCPDPVAGPQPGQQGTPPFFVQVQNTSAGTGLPFDSPTCIGRTGTTVFPGEQAPTDIFSLFVDLDNLGSPIRPLVPGDQFRFEIQPLVGTRQVVVASVRNPETTEFIEIPNPATPTLRPSGGSLADARLGQTQTISWTRPTFAVRDLFVSANVYTPSNQFCSSPQPAVTTDSTQATFKFLGSCFGQAPTSANVCVFYTGENGERSNGCWFFFDPSGGQ